MIVTGDFDNWSKTIKLDFRKDQDKFMKTVKLNESVVDKGDDIYFKFIVDGDWLTSPQYKVDNSHPSNNYIGVSDLERLNELVLVSSKSDTVYSDYTTVSAPSIGLVSDPVIVERADNADSVSVTNSEVTLTSNQPTSSPFTSTMGTGSIENSRGSSTIISRFKKFFN